MRLIVSSDAIRSRAPVSIIQVCREWSLRPRHRLTLAWRSKPFNQVSYVQITPLRTILDLTYPVSPSQHVLCEKPISVDVDLSKPLVAAAKANPHVKVMIGFSRRCELDESHINWTSRHLADLLDTFS